jgi:UDP-2,4-diacetamido-2,4,6-trideoxy-beta-L-altropyranose hydrolase
MKVQIRRALIKDSKFLFNLRNEKIVRKNSFNKKKISYRKHLDWYKKKLKNKNSFFLIAFIKKSKNIGIIRYEKEKEIFKVSIIIKKLFRKKGYGSLILKKSEIFLKKRTIIIAKIKKNNNPSFKLFKKNNYQLLKKDANLSLIKIV